MGIYSKLRCFSIVFILSLSAQVAIAQSTPYNLTGQATTGSMLDSFVTNYMGVEQLGGYLISLIVALGLAAIIAFHPNTYGKKEDLAEIEAPKTLIFYAMIGSLVGATVADYGPELGFIFFGLGGLMRFRTNTGNSRQTGRLILVALIGLCCGLKMLYIAVISTIVVWILIYFLERRTLYQVEIKKVTELEESLKAYRHALQQQKCQIVLEKKNEAKSKLVYIFSSPNKLQRDDIEGFFNRHIPESSRGSIDWV